MIKFASKKEADQIVLLWQEAFGDSREWVMMYLSENIENVLVYEEDATVMGMLSLLSVSFNGRKGYYVYGVATGSKYRSKGISSSLLEYAKKLVGKDGFLCLVPRNQGLFGFYKERGFFPVASVKTREFSREELLKMTNGTEVFEADCGEYYSIRKKYFPNLIEWDEEKLCSIQRFENGKYYKTAEGEGAFCYLYNEILYIKELCGGISVAAEIMKKHEAKTAYVTEKNTHETPSFMTWPEFSEEVFFNISID